jgi:hypothetical protein
VNGGAGRTKQLKAARRPGGPLPADQSRRGADGSRVVAVLSWESTDGTAEANGALRAKCGVLRSDEAICFSCLAILASGGTSNDDTASAINAVDEGGGESGIPWSVAPPPNKSAMSHVGNGAVNGSRMSTTSQMAESSASTVSADCLQNQYQTQV